MWEPRNGTWYCSFFLQSCLHEDPITEALFPRSWEHFYGMSYKEQGKTHSIHPQAVLQVLYTFSSIEGGLQRWWVSCMGEPSFTISSACLQRVLRHFGSALRRLFFCEYPLLCLQVPSAEKHYKHDSLGIIVGTPGFISQTLIHIFFM